jgi:hypothetical protein
MLLGGQSQRVGRFARLFGGAKYPGDDIAPVDERIQNRFAEVPLSHDGNAHFTENTSYRPS